MQIQGLSLPDYTLSVPKFSVAPQILPSFQIPSKLGWKAITDTGFSKSTKRMSDSPSGRRVRGGFVRVRCGGMDQNVDIDDGFYIRKCVELARRALGLTSPNPMVGCVIVKDGKIVGQGFHPKAGQPHAEVFALRDAGDLAENATAYVSLEPCNHYGRTPPCTEALIKAKVKKVVVGMVDPNPIVASNGVNKLRDAGIEVTVGVEEELCKRLNEAYIHRMLTRKPLITVRYSLSVNGQLSEELGDGAADSGGYYSKLLQEYDAIVLSKSSSSENFPLPSSKEPGANQPLRIILPRNQGSKIRIPALGQVVTSDLVNSADTLMGTAPYMVQEDTKAVVLDHISLEAISEYCNQQGLCSVMLDVRGNLFDFEELIKEGIEKHSLSKIVVEMLPLWRGENDGSHVVALKSLRQKREIIDLHPTVWNQSVVLEGYFKP